MNLFAAASAPGSTVRNVVVKSSTLVYGAVAAGPDVVPRGRHGAAAPARTAVERSLLEVEGYVRDFAEDNPHVDGVAAALLERARPRHRHAAHQGPRSCRWCPSVLGFDPRFQFVHEDDVMRAILLRARPRGARHLQRRRRRPAALERGRQDLRQAHRSRCPPSARAWPPRRCAASASTCPPELLDLLRYGRGIDNRRLKRGRLPATATRRPARWRPSSRRCACGARSANATPPTATSDDVEQFFRHSPAVVRDQRRRRADRRPAWPWSPPTITDRRRRRHPRRPRAPQRARPGHGATRSIAAFDELEADDDVGAVVVTGAPPAFCAGADLSHLGVVAARGPARGSTRGSCASAARPLPDHRRGQRRRRRRGHEPGAGLRRAPGRPPGPVRHPVPAARPPPGRRPHLDVPPDRRPPGGGRRRAVRRGARRRGGRARSGWCGAASTTTPCCPTALRAGRPGGGRPPELVARIKATIADMADVATHDEAVDVRARAAGLVARPARLPRAPRRPASSHQLWLSPTGELVAVFTRIAWKVQQVRWRSGVARVKSARLPVTIGPCPNSARPSLALPARRDRADGRRRCTAGAPRAAATAAPQPSPAAVAARPQQDPAATNATRHQDRSGAGRSRGGRPRPAHGPVGRGPGPGRARRHHR